MATLDDAKKLACCHAKQLGKEILFKKVPIDSPRVALPIRGKEKSECRVSRVIKVNATTAAAQAVIIIGIGQGEHLALAHTHTHTIHVISALLNNGNFDVYFFYCYSSPAARIAF